MTVRTFSLISVGLSTTLGGAALAVDAMNVVTQSLWWPTGVAVVTATTLLSRWWVARASEGSPMGFVAAVNGSTAIKMLSLLALTAAYLITHKEGRVPFALGIFGVFAAQLVLFVWDIASLMRQDKKKS